MDEGDLTTEAILEAALAAFGSHGFRATSLSQIASAAKVSRPTLYARYPDKIHLFRAVLQRGNDLFVDSFLHDDLVDDGLDLMVLAIVQILFLPQVE